MPAKPGRRGEPWCRDGCPAKAEEPDGPCARGNNRRASARPRSTGSAGQRRMQPHTYLLARIPSRREASPSATRDSAMFSPLVSAERGGEESVRPAASAGDGPENALKMILVNKCRSNPGAKGSCHQPGVPAARGLHGASSRAAQGSPGDKISPRPGLSKWEGGTLLQCTMGLRGVLSPRTTSVGRGHPRRPGEAGNALPAPKGLSGFPTKAALPA